MSGEWRQAVDVPPPHIRAFDSDLSSERLRLVDLADRRIDHQLEAGYPNLRFAGPVASETLDAFWFDSEALEGGDRQAYERLVRFKIAQQVL